MSIYNVSKRSLVLKESPLSIGWQQGTVFRAPTISFTWNDLSGIRADELVVKHRKTKAGERFVLITQDCDITASEKLEPYVEALLCRIEKNQEFLSKADRNSARWFVIDIGTGLVAHAKYSVSQVLSEFDKVTERR